MMFSFYAISSLINALGSSFLGAFVYLKSRDKALSERFVALALSVFVWSFCYFLWQIAETAGQALFWSKGLMVGAIFIPITFLHFTLAFLEKTKEEKRILQLSYFAGGLLLLLNLTTSLMIKKVEQELFFPYWPKPGFLFSFFIILFFFCFGYGFYLLLKAKKQSSGIVAMQIKYLIAGEIIAVLGGTTNFFLWYGIKIPPVGNWMVILYILLLAYTILKHRLLNIRIIATEIFIGLISTVLFIDLLSTQEISAKIFRLGILISFVSLGLYLIRSVTREIARMEKMEKMTAELERAYAELKNLDQAKSEFISIASHQLRTPLSAIKGYISLLLENSYGNLEDRARNPLKNIYQSNERLIAMVNHLLNISRIEGNRMKLDLKKTSIEKIIAGILETMKIKAKEKNLYLRFRKSKEAIPEITVDEEKISQAILNLVDNAIHYTKNGGVVVGLEKDSDSITIKVKDTGVGLEEEDLNQIKSFSRGKQGSLLWTEGVGLGLYVTKKFVEIHQGKIWSKSDGPNKGSTFFIKLPLK